MGIFGLVIIVFLLGSGIGFLIYSLRMLRRGSEVTAEEAIKWRRKVRKQGFDASPDMNPDITDILVRAWRTANGWINLGFGIGALLAGIGCSIFFAITGGALGGDDLVLYLAFAASILMALCPCVVICLVLGFRRIRREQNDITTGTTPRRLRDYRSLIVGLYLPIVSIVNLAFVTTLVTRLTPDFNWTSLARTFALPGMWSVPLLPAIYLAVVIIGEVVTRWITVQPPLYLP